MILVQEITAIAKNLQLEPTTIEKDYVLSWVLYAISKNSQLSQWLFKGGTCLKKCYFETYRFSEDLDFTVPRGAIYTVDEIRNALNEVAHVVYDETGINLKRQEIEVEESINKRNNKTYVAKFTYFGPLNLPSRNSQRIKFDISNDEIIVAGSDMRDVFHPYSDAPNSDAKVKCYSVNEILAEKTRAIYERQGRARDIYDIVNISRNFREDVNREAARSGVKKKFDFIGISNPSVELILSQLDLPQLKANWDGQLQHQVEVLPPVESFYNDLKLALAWWMEERPIEIVLPLISSEPNETSLPRIHFPLISQQFSRRIGHGYNVSPAFFRFADQVRYAARNRLCIEIEYHGIKRVVEPYSIKQPKTGSQLLYVYELIKGAFRTDGIRSYKTNEITGVRVMKQAFSPKYVVEL